MHGNTGTIGLWVVLLEIETFCRVVSTIENDLCDCSCVCQDWLCRCFVRVYLHIASPCKCELIMGSRSVSNDTKVTQVQRLGSKFEADDKCRNARSPFSIAGHDFRAGLSTCAPFPPDLFELVMLNLIQNPNLTSTYLFRADIFYDSVNDVSYQPEDLASGRGDGLSSFVKHMKPEYQPLVASVAEWTMRRTIVRQLVPRNPKLDRPMVQTCHLLDRIADNEEQTLVLYLPHIASAEDMPFYHPKVQGLGFLYVWDRDVNASLRAPGSFSIHVSQFEGDTQLDLPDSRLSRTLLKLLQVIHKHAIGMQNGYQKRVHHDQIVPQRRFQDTYTRLKGKYAKNLVDTWQEVTDPSKHVFEDLGIAAFLIELWHDMYEAKGLAFPGFVDIGCGNGLLVHLLKMEGFEGWGFDIRQRKSWKAYPEAVRDSLEERILVPAIFQRAASQTEDAPTITGRLFHDGAFPPGTFIISNHADELTAWTPILARLSQCPFLAIPCCSHNLAGERFRAPAKACAEAAAAIDGSLRDAHEVVKQSAGAEAILTEADSSAVANLSLNKETGSLKQSNGKSMPSQYATLCAYVASIAARMAFQPEKEIMRIPSTRNTAILGRVNTRSTSREAVDADAESAAVTLIEEQLQQSIAAAGRTWLQRAQMLVASKGSGH